MTSEEKPPNARERENEQLRMEENIEMMTTDDEANAQMATTIMDEEQNANLTDRELLILDRKRREFVQWLGVPHQANASQVWCS